MPAVVSRGRGRRTINEINMVPFIDVMLVLLIIFMVTAPLITTSVVDLPTLGAKASANKPKFVELVVSADETMKLRVDGKEVGRATFANLAAQVASAQAGDPETPVVIAGDKAVKYDVVVRAMGALKQAGVQRVGLSVKSTPGS